MRRLACFAAILLVLAAAFAFISCSASAAVEDDVKVKYEVVDASDVGMMSMKIVRLPEGFSLNESAASAFDGDGVDIAELLGAELPEGVRLELAKVPEVGDQTLVVRIVVDNPVGSDSDVTLSVRKDWMEDSEGNSPEEDVVSGIRISSTSTGDKSVSIVIAGAQSAQIRDWVVDAKVVLCIDNASVSAVGAEVLTDGADATSLVVKGDIPGQLKIAATKAVEEGARAIRLSVSAMGIDNRDFEFKLAIPGDWLVPDEGVANFEDEYSVDFSLVANAGGVASPKRVVVRHEKDNPCICLSDWKAQATTHFIVFENASLSDEGIEAFGFSLFYGAPDIDSSFGQTASTMSDVRDVTRLLLGDDAPEGLEVNARYMSESGRSMFNLLFFPKSGSFNGRKTPRYAIDNVESVVKVRIDGKWLSADDGAFGLLEEYSLDYAIVPESGKAIKPTVGLALANDANFQIKDWSVNETVRIETVNSLLSRSATDLFEKGADVTKALVSGAIPKGFKLIVDDCSSSSVDLNVQANMIRNEDVSFDISFKEEWVLSNYANVSVPESSRTLHLDFVAENGKAVNPTIADVMIVGSKSLQISDWSISDSNLVLMADKATFNSKAAEAFKEGYDVTHLVLRGISEVDGESDSGMLVEPLIGDGSIPDGLRVIVAETVHEGDTSIKLVLRSSAIKNVSQSFVISLSGDLLAPSGSDTFVCPEYRMVFNLVAQPGYPAMPELSADQRRDAVLRISDAFNPAKIAVEGSQAHNENFTVRGYQLFHTNGDNDEVSESKVNVADIRRASGGYMKFGSSDIWFCKGNSEIIYKWGWSEQSWSGPIDNGRPTNGVFFVGWDYSTSEFAYKAVWDSSAEMYSATTDDGRVKYEFAFDGFRLSRLRTTEYGFNGMSGYVSFTHDVTYGDAVIEHP